MSGISIVPPTLSDSQIRSNRLIAWLTGILTLLLTAFSFILSFNALADLAAEYQVSIPVLFPLVVEAGVIIFSLNALYRSLHGESARVQWTLIIGSSVLAGAFNVLHAQSDLVSRVIAAMPSLFLLLSFETFLGQIKHRVVRANVIHSIDQLEGFLNDRQSEIDALQAQAKTLNADIDKLAEQQAALKAEIAELRKQKRTAEAFNKGTLGQANVARLANKQQALDALVTYYSQYPNASLSQAGEAIGRSKSTVSNYLEELETNGRVQRNGDGVEVLA